MLQKFSSFRKKSSDDRTLRAGSTFNVNLGTSTSRSATFESVQSDSNASRVPTRRDSARGSITSLESRSGNEPDSGPLGLSVVYAPNNGHKADIIFVHGLGGTSRWTWSKNKDPELFWPLTFLALEADICLARVMTFGYNSAFHKAGDGKTSVLDFAENLLHDLKFSEDNEGNNLNIGAVPLIFVAHSMGGLVVKEVCIQGSRRPQYESIIDAVEAIVFLATPHRGAQVAQLLNRILSTVLASGTKQYVSDLLPTSFTLESQAESFRHIANKFKLVSFYETKPTPLVKNTKMMILGKETSVLGYPDEVSRALDADHHHVCKFDDRLDPNYIIVRNALRALMKPIVQQATKMPPSDRESLGLLQTLLAIGELPSVDLLFYRSQWKAGTCNWLLEEKSYLEWSQIEEPGSQLLWLNGGPATGKSVLSTFVINALKESGASCQYFFVRHSQPKKRTLSLLLRSIAYQVAQDTPDFLQRVAALGAEQLDFETMDPKTIWDRLFRSILFRMQHDQQSYWIIDGLDEADTPRTFIELLSELSISCPSIRVLVTSRNTAFLAAAFEPLHPKSISIDGRLEDIRFFIRQQVVFTGGAELKEKIITKLMKRAENNFLFVNLAVAELNLQQNRSYDEVKRALSRFPKGMAALYDRMARSIAQSSESDRAMATTILQSVNCSSRALSIPELSQIFGEQRSDDDHFRASILAVCCGFVLIDEGRHDDRGNVLPTVAMIHQTSREYLLGGDEHPFQLNLRSAHAQMFQNCMVCLMSNDLRTRIKQNQTVEFVDYAANFWSLHLLSTPTNDKQALAMLKKFLTDQKSNKEWVLIWINYLAANNELRVLSQTSTHLSKYATKLGVRDNLEVESGKQILELRALLESIAVDLIKIAGKFGTILRRNPRLIYKSIPPFCPLSSPIYQQFGQGQAKNLAVSGPSSMTEQWDDSLARMTFGTRAHATSVLAAGYQVAVLAPEGKVFMYESSAFEQPAYGYIDHQERVSQMAMNSTGTLAATYGYDATKIWEVSTGRCMISAPNIDSKPRPHTIIFTKEDNKLLVAFEDSKIRFLDLGKSSPTWEDIATIEEKEIPGHFLNVPSNMALNMDGSRLAVAYRGHPLSAWKLRAGRKPKHSGHCWRRGQSRKKRGEVEDMVWHPRYKLLLGVYIDGTVFKWRPGFSDSSSKTPRWEPKEIATGASKIAISRDGQLFVTGDPRGAVKIYTTLGFHLLYHLASEDMIGGITFSPDMRRLYDTRGYYASAWEPTALVRWTEQTDSTPNAFDARSETSIDKSSDISVNFTRTIDPIKVIATPVSRHYIYCTGTVGGGVYLYHTQNGKLAEVQRAEGLFGIERMAFSRDGKYLCFTNSIKTLVIASINYDDKSQATVIKTELELSVSDEVRGYVADLLFNQDTTHVLVQGSSSVHTISLNNLSIEYSADLDTLDTRWISHPSDRTRIIGFSTSGIQVLDWNLQKHHAYIFPFQDTLETSIIQGKIDRALPTCNGKHILVQVSPHARYSSDKTFFSIETSLLPTSKTDASKINQIPIINPIMIPPEISSQILLALGFVKDNRLVFLSKTFSVCYWQIEFSQLQRISPADGGTVPEKEKTVPSFVVKEIFPLPGDWVSQDSLSLSTIWTKEKSFLCPRNGEVAMVRSPELRVGKD